MCVRLVWGTAGDISKEILPKSLRTYHNHYRNVRAYSVIQIVNNLFISLYRLWSPSHHIEEITYRVWRKFVKRINKACLVNTHYKTKQERFSAKWNLENWDAIYYIVYLLMDTAEFSSLRGKDKRATCDPSRDLVRPSWNYRLITECVVAGCLPKHSLIAVIGIERERERERERTSERTRERADRSECRLTWTYMDTIREFSWPITHNYIAKLLGSSWKRSSWKSSE